MTRHPLLRFLGYGIIGLVIGAVGTLACRSVPPLMMIMAIVMVAATALYSRARAGWAGLIGFLVGNFVIIQLMALPGPGGDVLIPADTLGYVWMFGGGLIGVLAAFAPRTWFVAEVRRSDQDPPSGPKMTIEFPRPESAPPSGNQED